MSSKAQPTKFLLASYKSLLCSKIPQDVVEYVWSFCQPASLKEINPHPKDKCIEFYDEIQLPDEMTPRLHLYIVNGDPNSYISTTTFIHKFANEFDADRAITMIFNGRNYQSSPYFGMSRQQIKDAWELNRQEAASLGTAMHANLENFYNGISVKDEFLETKEWQLFQTYLADNPRLEPFRTEWEVFDEEHFISGSIDMIYADPDKPGHLIIKDWKRSKEIKWSSRDRLREPIQHLDDCNGMHYSLQVNLYKWILEKNYGVRISRLFMVRFHPNSDAYEEIEVENMQDEIKAMVALRLAEIKQRSALVAELLK
jgi:hypothetical protein